MPIVLHGDAAFSGQGIVPEVMEVSSVLKGEREGRSKEEGKGTKGKGTKEGKGRERRKGREGGKGREGKKGRGGKERKGGREGGRARGVCCVLVCDEEVHKSVVMREG